MVKKSARRTRSTHTPAFKAQVAVSAAQAGDHAGQPGLGARHDVHSGGARLRVPHRGGGRVQPPRAGSQVAITLEAIQGSAAERM